MTISDLTATEALRRIRGGELSIEDYARQVIARAEKLAKLNVFITFDPEQFLEDARRADKAGGNRALCGLPIALKDNIDTKGYPTSGGTAALKGHRPAANAPAVQKLLDQGAIIAGKLNLHELAMGITSNNGVFGAVHNPYNPDMIPGGSSGGSAAAVAAGIVPVALGTDTGGSARIPGALCGVVGFRPTMDRYGNQGAVPISHTRDTIGTFAHTVEDVMLVDEAITAEKSLDALPDLHGVRLGVPRGYFYENLEPDVATAAEKTLDLLRAKGAVLVEADIPDVGPLDEAVSFPVVLYEFLPDLEKYLCKQGCEITVEELVAEIGSPDVKGLSLSLLGEGAMPEEAYRAAIEVHRPALQKAYADYFKAHDVAAVIFPTTPLTARPIGQDETVELNGEQVPTFGTFIRNTDPGSNAGLPGISLPVGLSSAGLPIGMELDGPDGSDRKLLQLAAAIQDVLEPMPAPKL
ncbi:indoleacetamide hydrolase [Emcibacter nanhaiensis]|uniref:Indoleacetamide hydrolase n=1 Tax=Emcibacter nanhaiensis TaxID=1505037 RepID=A0A501PFS5_9PROT|nr:indoleacetamide hydrolase [Emcibacter nanhaiensis]TPD59025.1 indoleacetamide hydrolase [Emcibacter nanhaiensis]